MEGLGSIEKKMKINGKYLNFSEIKFSFPDIFSFLSEFYDSNPNFTVYTSGSTGKPKPIEVPKAYMLASAQRTLMALNLQPGDKSLLCLPLNRIGGIMMLVRCLEGDLDLYPMGSTSRPISNTKVHYDFAAMVPYQVDQSLEDLHKVKKLIIGGAPISPSLEKELIKVPIQMYHTYGMTETISHIALRDIKDSASVFKALPKVEFATDARQCLVINAPEIGINQLATNDVVELISPTQFLWKGRYDHVVNSGGIKLFPEEIEKKIGDIGVNYFLFGEADEKLGERLAMIVEGGGEMTLKRMQAHFASLGRYEGPRVLYKVSQFATNAGGKLDRKSTISQLR